MPTGQQIVNGVLTTLGVLEQGGTPSVSDSTDTLNELNNMWMGWAIDEGLIFAEFKAQFPVSAGIGEYTIGSGAVWSIQLPSKIYQAFFFVQGGGSSTAVILSGSATLSGVTVIDGGSESPGTVTIPGLAAGAAIGSIGVTPALPAGVWVVGNANSVNTVTIQVLNLSGGPITLPTSTYSVTGVTSGSTTSGQNRTEIDVVNAQEYYSHHDLSATAAVPDELYYDYNPDSSAFGLVELWPIPTSVSAFVQLIMGVAFRVWTLVDNYNVPYGFQDTINYALAFRVMPRYGQAVAQQTAEIVTELAEKAELRVRKMNRSNRQLPEGTEFLVPPQSGPQGGPTQ